MTHRELLRAIYAGAAAIAVAVVAAVWLGAGSSTADSSTDGGAYCPDDKQLQSAWESDGLEEKASSSCPDPDPLPAEDPANPREKIDPVGKVDGPATLAAAQEAFDPDNDPLILIAQEDNGDYYAVYGSVIHEKDVPPSSVETVEDYQEWLAANSTEEKK